MRLKNKYLGIVIIFIIILGLEIFVFNINSFRLIGKNYEKKTYKTTDMKINDIQYDKENNEYIIIGQKPSIEIKNINTEIGTVKLDVEVINAGAIEYQMLYTDQTSAKYRALPKKVLVNDLDRSQYVACYLSGKSPDLAITFQGVQNVTLKINKIELNESVPFHFSMLRVMILSTIAIFIYQMFASKNFKEPFTKENNYQLVVLMLVVALFIILVVWMSATTIIKPTLYNSLTDSILNGKSYIQIEPNEELKNLQNPYDTTQREFTQYIWDAAFYHGKYYAYFGILPVILLYIPMKVFFNVVCDSQIATLIFSVFIIINLTRILVLLYKKWFKNLSFNYLIMSIVGTLAGSLIFWINKRALVYEVALSAGICFSTAGVYYMFKAFEKDKANYKYMFLGAICLALSVACRPNHLLVSLIFAPKLMKTFIENIKKKENLLKFICAVAIPYIVVGVALMGYNYIRFDSIFEFGTNYQLTLNDMKDLKHRIMTVPVGLYTQLFKLPQTSNYFPFFTLQNETIPFYGYYCTLNYVCGLFLLNPINYILILLIGLRKKVKEKDAYSYIKIFTIVAIILSIINVMLAGTIQRYSMDYAWILNIASYLTLFLIVSNIKSEQIKKYILKFTIATTLFMLTVNFIVGGVVSEDEYLKRYFPRQYYAIRYGVCFWE